MVVWDNANNELDVLSDFLYNSTLKGLHLGLDAVMLSGNDQSVSNGNFVVQAWPTPPVRGMFVDYTVFNNITNGFRAGTFRSVNDQTPGGVVWDDTSTTDLNGSTGGFRFITNVVGGNFQLIAVADHDRYDISYSIKLILK